MAGLRRQRYRSDLNGRLHLTRMLQLLQLRCRCRCRTVVEEQGDERTGVGA